MVDYMRQNPSQFSELVKILDRTNISPYLNAYGTYTCFAPTNDAIKLYLQQIGKTSTDDLDTTTLKNMVRLHLIQDTLTTQVFTDGKLYAPTMYGQYLTTSVNESGVTIVNRQAAITQSNIRTGNGYIHVIDHVLRPATLTMAQMVEQNPKYSIFSQALKATGLYDTLNIVNNTDTTRRWLTLLAESDSVLKIAGYTNYAALAAKFSNTGNPKNPNDSLFLYMAYHILFNIKYVADIVSFPSHTTLAPLAVVTTTLDDQRVLLNQATFNGVFEAGIPIDRANSDNSCTNGVMHTLLGDIYLKVRTPVRVDFDIAAQPEIVKLTSVYRKPGKNQFFTIGQLADVTWQNTSLTNSIQYYCEAGTSTNNYWWNDGFGINLRFGNSAANNWVEFRTPLLVSGKYKVWICYRKSSGNPYGAGSFTQVSFDGKPTSRIVDFTQGLPNSSATDAVLESQGFKRYSYNTPNSNNVGQLAGIIDVGTTDRHIIRFQAIKDGGSGVTPAVTLDFIQFIPVDMPQTRPVYARDGTIYP
jgi:uncharacterized surface protein with fasciclin (FAS1) repeats